MCCVTERFHDLAKAVAESREAPTLPMLVLPSDMENLTSDDLAALARRSWADVLALLRPAAGGAA